MDAQRLADDVLRLGAPHLARAIREPGERAEALSRLSRAIGAPSDAETIAFALASDPDGAAEAVRYLEADYRSEAAPEAEGPFEAVRAALARRLLLRFWRRLV